MEDLEKKVLGTIKKYKLLKPEDKLVLAVSGGPDSMAMLDILNKLLHTTSQNCPKGQSLMTENCQKGLFPVAENCQKNTFPMTQNQIVVAHVNHMIREEATQDEAYVRDYCKKNNIEFYSKSIDVQKIANNNKIGTEEAGRIERYKFFDEVMEKTNSNKIVIAHNKNDNAETIIMNILRGSGITGLKGIEPKRGKYIRPLIECERQEIEDYCEKQNLNPRIDKTNFENVYTRNKIRNIVIPYVKQEFNPNIINTLNRLSEIVTEEEEYIQKQVEKVYKEIVLEEIKENIEEKLQKTTNNDTEEVAPTNKKEIVLDLKKFNSQEKVIKTRLVLYTITKLFGNAKGIEKVHIEDIIELCNNNIGNKYLLPNKNTKVLVKNHKIYISRL